MKAIRNDIKVEVEVRKMTDDEIHNDDQQYYCDDETSTIYGENELTFL